MLEARAKPSLTRFGRTLSQLALLGQIEVAAELHQAIQLEKGSTPEDARRHAEERVASHRIATAIRGGADVQTALDTTPGVHAGALWIATLDLMGRNPYSAGPGRPRVDDRVLNDIATALIALARADTLPARRRSLEYAAEVAAMLGRVEDARAALALIPPGEAYQAVRLSPDLIAAIGPEEARAFYDRTGLATKTAPLDIAFAEADDARAERVIRDTYQGFATAEPFPEYGDMRDLIFRTAEAGRTDLALSLARQLAGQAATGARVFPAFPHIDAARALHASGAPDDEIRAALDRAEAEFPGNENAVIGVGVVGGTYTWSGGIGEQARRETAHLRADLGETDRALRLMDGLTQPNFNWPNLLQPDLPLTTVKALLAGLPADVTREDEAYIRVQTASQRLSFADTEENRAWAKIQIENALATELKSGQRAGSTYRTATRTAFRMGETTLRDKALILLARHAMDVKSPGALIDAAETWQSFGPSTD